MQIDIVVTGMTCDVCRSHVEKACLSVSGVKEANVNLLTGRTRITGENFSEIAVVSAIKKAGYGINTNGKQNADKILIRLIVSASICVLMLLLQMLIKPPTLISGILLCVLALAVMSINRKYYFKGIKNLFMLSPNMDTLVAIGSLSAFAFSLTVFIIYRGNEALYFDSAAMIPTFVSIGKYLEGRAKSKAADAISKLYELVPEYCNVERENGTEVIRAEEIKPGDVVVLGIGENVPVDGTVIQGTTETDESSLTGESMPVFKEAGSKVFAGTVNISGAIKIRTDVTYTETNIAKTIKTVRDIETQKAPTQRITDAVSKYFVWAVIAIAALVFAIWMIVRHDVGFALSRGISVLVVSCPCALGLATPVAITLAGFVATKNGIMFKSAEPIETLGKIKTACFDKTGTVTESRLKVKEFSLSENVTKDELFKCAHITEVQSSHPVGKAVIEYIGGDYSESPESCVQLPGKGIVATLGNDEYKAGNASFIGTSDESSGTAVYFSKNGTYLGMMTLTNEPRKDALKTVRDFANVKVKTVLLTGDNEGSTSLIKEYFDETYSGLLPTDKADIIKKQQKPVMMAGDGINDAPPLSAADVGISVYGGTDVATLAGNVVIMSDGMDKLYSAYMLSVKTLRVIYENLIWAFCYNIIGIPLAAGLFGVLFGIYMSPSFSSLAMSVSSILVVSNSLRILKYDKLFKKGEKHNMKTTQYNVKGMMCHNCERHAVNAVLSIYPNATCVADFEKGSLTVTADFDIDAEKIKEAIKEEGYEVI